MNSSQTTTSSQKKQENKNIDEQLIDAATVHNLSEINRLIKAGANPKYVRHTDVNGWYSGNTHTALYNAVHAKFEDQTNYVDVLETLLKAGANPNFQAVRGGWNHCTSYPLFNGVAYTLSKFKSQAQKIRFIQTFVKHGININQNENHSRSKNWRGYSTHTCFIFQMMDSAGIGSKINELQHLFSTVDFQKLKNEREKHLRQQFIKEFPQYKKQNENNNEEEQKQKQDQKPKPKEKKVPELTLIKALINFGANPNSSKSESFWQNYNNDSYQEQDYALYSKFDQTISQTSQTILHRAIMNDLPQLVSYVLQKGGKISAKCRITVKTPMHPNQWPEKIKERKKKQMNETLFSNEVQKGEILKKIKQCGNQEEKKKLGSSLGYYEFQIFKAKRFVVENQVPHPAYSVKQLGCLEIAEALKVSQETKQIIIDWIKNHGEADAEGAKEKKEVVAADEEQFDQ